MRRMLVLIAVCLISGGAGAQTLQEALVRAYGNHPDLLGAQAGLRATDEQVAKARAGWLPTVAITSGLGRQSNGVSDKRFSQNYNSAHAGLTLSQPIFDGGSAYYNTAQARNSVFAGRADLIGTEQSVLLNAATAYQDVLRERALLSLAREKERALGQHFSDLTIRFKAGALTQTDVDQANSRYLSVRAASAAQVGQLEASEAAFLAAVGEPPRQLTPPAPPANLPPSSEEAARIADQLSPTVLGSLFRERAARAQIDVARSALLPSVGASINVGRDYGYTVPNSRTNALGATLNLSVPLYQGGANVASVKAATETAEQSRMTTLSTRRTAIQNAVSAFASWRSNTEALKISAQQVTAAQAAYSGVLRQAAIGARGTYELLGQLQDLFDARATQINLQHDTIVSAYRVLVALGRFTVDGLRLPVEMYDPTAHYEIARTRGGLP